MNTATIMAAAVFGYTWGYQPLDNHTTEFLVQLSQEDMHIMSDGSSEILLDIPPEAGPVGRVRIIVGDEKLPRESLPPSELDTARTAERPSLPPEQPDPSRAPPFAARGGERYPPVRSDPRVADSHAGHNHDSGGADVLDHRTPIVENHGAPPLDGPALSAIDVGPPAVTESRGGAAGRRDMADRYEDAAAVTTNPYDSSRGYDRRADELTRDDFVAPPFNSETRFADDAITSSPPQDGRFDDRDRLDSRRMVDVPPLSSAQQYALSDGAGRGATENSLVEKLGPSLTAVTTETPLDWVRAANGIANDGTNNDEHSLEPKQDAHDHASHTRSPSDETVDDVRKVVENENDGLARWRWWTVLTSSTAFGLFVLNFYQWGTYKSIRQRYLSLLRRTGEV